MHLLDFRIVIGVERFKLGENCNNRVLEIPMVLFYLYNRT